MKAILMAIFFSVRYLFSLQLVSLVIPVALRDTLDSASNWRAYYAIGRRRSANSWLHIISLFIATTSIKQILFAETDWPHNYKITKYKRVTWHESIIPLLCFYIFSLKFIVRLFNLILFNLKIFYSDQILHILQHNNLMYEYNFI